MYGLPLGQGRQSVNGGGGGVHTREADRLGGVSAPRGREYEKKENRNETNSNRSSSGISERHNKVKIWRLAK